MHLPGTACLLVHLEHGNDSSHLYFFSLQRSHALAARGRLARFGGDLGPSAIRMDRSSILSEDTTVVDAFVQGR